MKVNLLLQSIFALASVAIADDTPTDPANNCNLWQVCENHSDQTPGTSPTTDCEDPSKVTIPVFTSFDPAPITTTQGQANIATACPFYETDTPLCCNGDTAAIMVHNYQQLDGVFATDCPICAVNLKRMWCEYACNPSKAQFLKSMGSTPVDNDYEYYTNVQVSIDSDYACSVYSSCKQTSFIAAAGVSSSVAFLNFLGFNGADYSLSFINFTTDDKAPNDPPLNSSATQCQDPVPDDGILYGYANTTNSSCSFCQKACPPPIVDDVIGFLDGFSWRIVGYSYLGFVLFTIGFQVLMHCVIKKRKLAAIEQERSQNQTGSTAVGTSNMSNPKYAQVNISDSGTNNSAMRSNANLSYNE